MKSDSPVAWNPITRLTHWLIAIPVLLDFFIEGGDLTHEVLGYIAMGTTVFRLGWGLITKDEANFASFPLHPKKLFSMQTVHYQGHNPQASWVYILMWILVIALGVTGFMMGMDKFWGEDWLENLHETFSNILMGLVALHFAGLIFDSWRFKRKTWLGMFTGKKS